MKYLVLVALVFAANLGFAQKPAQTVQTQTLRTTEAQSGIDFKKVEQDLADMSQVIPLDDRQKAMFKELFTTKQRMLNDSPNLSDERKSIIHQTIERKLQASLMPELFEKLKSNTEVFERLIK